MTAAEPEQLSPLEMARNCVAGVRAIADWQERDPLQAQVHEAGRMGKQSAELGACMALVSIAESLERIAAAAEQLSIAESLARIAAAAEQLEGGAADV